MSENEFIYYNLYYLDRRSCCLVNGWRHTEVHRVTMQIFAVVCSCISYRINATNQQQLLEWFSVIGQFLAVQKMLQEPCVIQVAIC